MTHEINKADNFVIVVGDQNGIEMNGKNNGKKENK